MVFLSLFEAKRRFIKIYICLCATSKPATNIHFVLISLRGNLVPWPYVRLSWFWWIFHKCSCESSMHFYCLFSFHNSSKVEVFNHLYIIGFDVILFLSVCLWHQTQKQQLTALSGGVSYSWLGSARNNEVCNWWYHFIIIAVADFIHGSFCGASNRNGVIKFSETEKTRREEKNTNTHINVSQQRIYTLQSVRNNSKPHF